MSWRLYVRNPAGGAFFYRVSLPEGESRAEAAKQLRAARAWLHDPLRTSAAPAPSTEGGSEDAQASGNAAASIGSNAVPATATEAERGVAAIEDAPVAASQTPSEQRSLF